MESKRPNNQYKETQIKTSNQGQLIVMLYDGAIKFIKTALENIPKRKLDLVNTNIIRSQEIISELMLALNFESGDFANKLFNLYNYINRRLIEANVNKEEKPLVEVLKYLTELRDAWSKASQQVGEMTDPVQRQGVNIAL